MFLNAYKRNWLETEGYSFEDKMIDDLSVSNFSNRTNGDLSSSSSSGVKQKLLKIT